MFTVNFELDFAFFPVGGGGGLVGQGGRGLRCFRGLGVFASALLWTMPDDESTRSPISPANSVNPVNPYQPTL